MIQKTKDILKKAIGAVIIVILVIFVFFSNSKNKELLKEKNTGSKELSDIENTKEYEKVEEVKEKSSSIKDQKAQYFSLATEQMQKGDFRSAIENFQKVVNIDPGNNFEPQNIRALSGELSLYLVLARNGDYRDSDNKRIIDVTTKIIDSGIVNAPDIAGIYFARGTAYATSKQYDKAIADLDIVIKLDPSMKEEALDFREGILREKGGQ